MWPREHGAWAVLAVPPLVGLAAVGGAPWPIVVLFSLAAFGAFCLRVPVQSLASRAPAPEAPLWTLLFAGTAAAGGLPLLLHYGRLWLLAFAVPGAVMLAFNVHANLNRRAFSLANEVAGILTLCLGAPAAAYAATGAQALPGWMAWALCAAYFIGPVFHVKMAALQHRGAADPALAPALRRMRRVSADYHVVALGLVALAAALDWAPALAVVPFAATLYRTWRRGAAAPARVDFQRLGYQEVAYATLFAVALVLGYRLSA